MIRKAVCLVLSLLLLPLFAVAEEASDPFAGSAGQPAAGGFPEGPGFSTLTEALDAITGFCFAHTELQRLWTQVDVRNLPSQRMLEKCGYTREGLIRQGKMVNTWCDYYIYGILSTDKRA